jgi:hypothetical protein
VLGLRVNLLYLPELFYGILLERLKRFKLLAEGKIQMKASEMLEEIAVKNTEDSFEEFSWKYYLNIK